MQASRTGFAPWQWALPWLVLAASAPLWLQWSEPAFFMWLNRACAALPDALWAAFSTLGNGWGVLALTAPLLVAAPRLMLAWLCAAPFAMLFARGGKAIITSPRPAAQLDQSLMRIVGEPLQYVSMPSGHTLTAFAVAAAIYFALPARLRARGAWLWALAALAGLARIAVGAHWPGDVAVGAALGVVSAMLGSVLLQRIPARYCAVRSWPVRGAALLVLLALYHLVFDEIDFEVNAWFQAALSALAALSLLWFVKASFFGPKPAAA